MALYSVTRHGSCKVNLAESPNGTYRTGDGAGSAYWPEDYAAIISCALRMLYKAHFYF